VPFGLLSKGYRWFYFRSGNLPCHQKQVPKPSGTGIGRKSQFSNMSNMKIFSYAFDIRAHLFVSFFSISDADTFLQLFIDGPCKLFKFSTTRWRHMEVQLNHFNLGTRWRWVVTLTPLPFYPLENSHRCLLRLLWPYSWSRLYGGKKNLLPPPGIKSRFLFRPASNIVAIPTELSQLQMVSVHDFR
jgi:hypothetical protein